ncbi:MAG TPA: hypothetical protein PLA03_13060 [Acidobacteriota bacterium]|nr:hypothetical protein [Acidobacteriota bacterium]
MKIPLLLSLIVFSLAFAPGLHAQFGRTSGIIITEAQQPPPPLPDKTRFNGTIINAGGKYYLGGRFIMEIDRRSTEEEVAKMKKRLAENAGSKRSGRGTGARGAAPARYAAEAR